MRFLVSLAAGVLFLSSGALGENPGNDPGSKPFMLSLSTSSHHEAPLGFEVLNELVFSRANKEYSESLILVAWQEFGDWHTYQPPYSFSGYESGYALQGSEGIFITSNADPDDETLSGQWNIWRGIGIIAPRDFKPLPAPVNSKNFECCMVNGPKNTFYFSSNRDGSWDIYEAEWKRTKFKNVKKLGHPNTGDNDEWPSYVDPDGRFMLFSSIRDTGLGGDDIYISYHDGETWSDGIILPEPVNSSSYDDSAILSSKGRLIYWSSRRPTDISKDVGNIYYLETDAPEIRELFPDPED